MDAGRFGDDSTPDGCWFVTEDGVELTPDEVLPTQDDPVVSESGKGPAAATVALVNAMLHFEKYSDNGIHPDAKVRPTMRTIIQWAADYELPNWQLLNEESSTQRTLLGGGIETLKRFPAK